MAKQDELEEILKTLENFVDKRKEKIIKKKNRADWKPKTLKPRLPDN